MSTTTIRLEERLMNVDFQVLGWIGVPCLVGLVLAIAIYFAVHDMVRDRFCKHKAVVSYRHKAYCASCRTCFGNADKWETSSGRKAEPWKRK